MPPTDRLQIQMPWLGTIQNGLNDLGSQIRHAQDLRNPTWLQLECTSQICRRGVLRVPQREGLQRFREKRRRNMRFGGSTAPSTGWDWHT